VSSQQLAQFLDSKLDQKLASFKRNFDGREDLHASQLKKLKTESKASSSFKFKGNKIQYEFNVASLDSLSMVSKSLLDGDLSKANAELEKHQSLIEKRNKLTKVLQDGRLLTNTSWMIWPKIPKTRKNCEPQNVER
jgi:hypothetical protein